MKVNMSYSVNFEDILESVERVYHEGRVDFETRYKSMSKTLSFSNFSLELDIEKVKVLRLALIEFDSKLNDVHNILIGYDKILKEDITSSQSTESLPIKEEIPEEHNPILGEENG